MSDAIASDAEAPDPGLAYALTVNGRERSVPSAWLGESLLYVLRERLGLPGSKNACDQGECGSCSVTLDGVLVCACCVLAADAVDADVRTVEGLAADGALSDVQQAFLDAGAVQCGFCTPGLVVAATDLLERRPEATELEIREAISGNLCRCTGYGRILEAVATARDKRRGGSGTPLRPPEGRGGSGTPLRPPERRGGSETPLRPPEGRGGSGTPLRPPERRGGSETPLRPPEGRGWA